MKSGIPVHLLNPKNFQAYGIKRNWDDVAKLAESLKLMGGNLPKNNDLFAIVNRRPCLFGHLSAFISSLHECPVKLDLTRELLIVPPPVGV